MSSLFLSSKSERLETKPYTKLALIYDEVMHHVNYRRWASYILEIINKFNHSATLLLDISCGTGTFLTSLKTKSFDLFGFDFSFEMVHVAKNKAEKFNKMIHLFQGDMTAFCFKREFDIIVCLYDSINYLLDFDTWQFVFKCAEQNLKSGGLFIFDICTERNSVEYFMNYKEKSQGSSYSYVRESTYNKRKKLHYNRFMIEFKKEPIKYIEIHKQKIFKIDEVLSFIKETNLELIGKFDGFSFNSANERSLRVHFVLRKW